MSGSRRLPVIAGVSGLGASVAAAALFPSLRSSISKYVGLSAPGGTWRFVAIALALLNMKNMPFVWHIRLLRALLYQLYFQPTELPASALFEPVIIQSRTPLLEIDYNLHKSNSTYFTDLDIARTNLVTAILRKGMRGIAVKQAERRDKERRRKEEEGGSVAPEAGSTDALLPPSAKFSINLGAVSCHFRREIRPYETFEVWTRLLTWDRKWLYVVSHFVRPGTARPEAFSLQPWRRQRAESNREKNERNRLEGLSEEERRAKLKGAVFATSIAKYVVKKGRLTIPPELVLERSDMLPTRPEGAPSTVSGSESTSESGRTPPEMLNGNENGVNNDGESPKVLEESLFPLSESSVAEGGGGDAWTWERVEREGQKGLKIAEMFAGLDGLYDVFDGGFEGKAMGEFGTLF